MWITIGAFTFELSMSMSWETLQTFAFTPGINKCSCYFDSTITVIKSPWAKDGAGEQGWKAELSDL